MDTVTDADRDLDIAAFLRGTEIAIAELKAGGVAIPDEAYEIRSLCRRALAAEAEVSRLRGILDAPRVALFADGREPSRNETHLLNLLSWRQQEAADATAERNACHTLFDEVLSVCGYHPAGPRPGLVEAVRRLREKGRRLADALACVQRMAAEDLRQGLCPPGGSLYQIEADARRALESEES